MWPRQPSEVQSTTAPGEKDVQATGELLWTCSQCGATRREVPPAQPPWEIVSGPNEPTNPPLEGIAWVYRIVDHWGRLGFDVRVELPAGELDANDPNTHPFAAQAQVSQGRSEVERILHLADPPDRMQLDSLGYRKWWRRLEPIPVDLF